MVEQSGRRELLVAKGWAQAAILVTVFGFTVLLWLAYRAHVDAPPIPTQVVDPAGTVLFTGDDIIEGQQIFLRNGLMEYGSIFGHGAYLGPDFTADYLRRAAQMATDSYGGPQSESARHKTIEDFKTNRYSSTTHDLAYSPAQAEAFQKLRLYYAEYFG